MCTQTENNVCCLLGEMLFVSSGGANVSLDLAVWLHETSRPHHMQAITDGVAKILPLTCGVKCCLLLYRGSIHSQSFASCLCARRHVPDDY